MTDSKTIESKPAQRRSAEREYVVAPGCGIFIDGPEGSGPGQAVKKVAGERVTLSNDEARHFVKTHQLEPYVPEEDEGDA